MKYLVKNYGKIKRVLILFGFMQEGKLQLGRVVVFALSREKDKKRIVKNWDLGPKTLKDEPYSIFRRFLVENISILFNKGESLYRHSKAIHKPPIRLRSVDARKERSGSNIVPFRKKGSKRGVLDDVRESKGRKDFLSAARKIAILFKQTPFWPRSYLFVVRFVVSAQAFRKRFVGILTAQLEQGRLAENTEKIMEVLKVGIIGDVVKKGLIYPHVISVDGKVRMESKAKCYEDSYIPASYFYNFLGMEEPRDAIDSLGREYGEYREHDPRGSLGGFVKWLDDEEILLATPLVDLVIDEIKMKVPLADFEERISIVRLGKGEMAVLIRGQDISVAIEDKNLLQDGTVRLCGRKEFLESVGDW